MGGGDFWRNREKRVNSWHIAVKKKKKKKEKKRKIEKQSQVVLKLGVPNV